MPTVPTRQRWLAPVLVVVAALTVSGGLLAQEYYDTNSSKDTNPRGSTTTSPQQSSASRQPRGSSTVELTDAASSHPQSADIRALLQDYFDAINERDYDLWASTVTADWVRQKPERQWRSGYNSTHEDDAVIYRVDPVRPQRLRVLVAFTSTQDPEDAPADMPSDCIRWHLALPAVLVNDEWALAKPPETTPERSRCSSQ